MLNAIHQKRAMLSPVTWDPFFLERSPMLAPLAPYAAALSKLCKWPPREALQELIAARGVQNGRGIPLRLVAPESIASVSYEERVYRDGELEMRQGDWHDFFNVLAWLVYPRAKAAVNERHIIARREERENTRRLELARRGANRGRIRDALTLFDESGAIVVSNDRELIEDLRAFRWKRLFWSRRDRVMSSMRFYIFGHAIFAKALSPYMGMTAHALLDSVGADFMNTPVERQIACVDTLAARACSVEQLTIPAVLSPLPVLGVPGWWRANDDEAFYDNTRYFRVGRRRAGSHDGQ
jgi:hypothetical protein